MTKKKFLITRLEESKILKKVSYEVLASNKKEAVSKLKKMKYENRDTKDEVQEDEWKPKEIISISKI